MSKTDKNADAGSAGKTEDNTSPAEKRRKDGTAENGKVKEYGGPKGPEPTRYGDWENKGIVSDF